LVLVSQQLARRWSAAKTQISTTVDDDTVILDTASGRYFSLEGVGSTLWQALQEPRSFAELLETVLEGYDVGVETAEHDVRALLDNLEEVGLVAAH
jgi:hypothetical protein